LFGTAFCVVDIGAARVTAPLGFDWILVDFERTPISPKLLPKIVKAINRYSKGTTAAVVKTYTAEQVRSVIEAAGLASLSDRAFPPSALTDETQKGGASLDTYGNDAALIVQLDSLYGFKNAAEICAIPGVDAILINTSDFWCTMCLPFGPNVVSPEYLAAITAAEAAESEAKKNNLPLAGFAIASLEEAIEEKRYQIVMVVADIMTAIVDRRAARATATTMGTSLEVESWMR
ncbi:hypothetical protein FRB97_003679, partial [Tulasnella sp. 331]